ncbi:MAG: hypothetical protein VST71_10215 [Nitrospirota bacterium]|nr:hypothetical protein [Nitrospirota bacterium]
MDDEYSDDSGGQPDRERLFHPFVVGRKNWLFSGHPRAAKASADEELNSKT